MAANCKALIFILVLLIAVPGFSQSDSLMDKAEQYFTELMERFEKTAGSKRLRGRSRTKTDQHFVWVMKRFPTMHEFVKTNKKDKVVNEVVRGAIPTKVYKDIPKDTWYSYLKRKKEAHEGVWFNEENGRYYLVWSRPIEIGKKKRFGGMVAVKVDLWGSFHKLSKQIEQHFLVLINRKVLYSHEWEKRGKYEAATFNVPGVKKAVIRYREEEMAAAEAEAATVDEPVDESVEEAESPAEESKGSGVKVFLILLVMVLIAGGVFLYIRTQKKRKNLLRDIDEQPPAGDI